MKKFKKIIIISIVVILVLILGIFGFYKVFKNKNSLSITEKTWINNNKNSIYTIFVPNDINIFGKSGDGVFFDFINDLEKDLSLKLNSTVYSINNNNDSLGFNVSTNYDNRDLLIDIDYYVLVDKNNVSVSNINNLSNKNIGIISDDLKYVSEYYNLSGNIKTYNSSDELFKSLNSGEIDYIIVPLTQYKDKIISDGLNVSYFFNDAKIYYYIHLSGDNTLNSIITKYYNTWIDTKYSESYNNNNYKLFVNNLNISELKQDKLTDKTYNFEYVVNQPYALLTRGKFSGIVSKYLNSFSKFSGIDFKYTKVRKFKDLKYDITKKKVDVYFDQYNYDNDYELVNANYNIDYYLISNRNNNISLDSLKSFKGTIYVQENSLLYKYLSNYSDITIKTYDKVNKVKRLIKKDNYVLVDKYIYDNYLIDDLNNTHILLENTFDNSYYFRVNGSDEFKRLFSSYINTLNKKEVIDGSLQEYFKNYEAGSKSVKLAKYIILLIIVLLIGTYLLIKNKKKVVLNTKVKNNEKIRYVDMLTSLKNRNYLNDRMEIWNQNTVYPQCVIVLDLNNVKYLNDTFGHEEGDKQIKAAANILFKTQLENSELLRTDGNEFMIYLVGYTEKRVVSYIKKLLKEFKKLPYEYGVAIGFSMIKDDLKLVEDAFNEATILMRKNKETFEDNDEK